MKRIPSPARCLYLHFTPTEQRRFDIPMRFRLLLDGQPVRTVHRLCGSMASQRIELTHLAHTVSLQLPDGTLLQRLSIPANGYHYTCVLSEDSGFAPTAFGPMRPTPDCPHADRLARLLSGKLTRMLDAASPICMLHKEMTERQIHHVQFEFWEHALIMHYVPESGYIPDLKHDFHVVEPYSRVKDVERLTLSQTLQLEAAVTEALRSSSAADSVDFFRDEDGFFCAAPKK